MKFTLIAALVFVATPVFSQESIPANIEHSSSAAVSGGLDVSTPVVVQPELPPPPMVDDLPLEIKGLGGGFDGAVSSMRVMPDGRIVVAGSFTHFDGEVSGPGLTRLDQNGVLDTAFNNRIKGLIEEGDITGVTLMPDGSIVAGGEVKLKSQTEPWGVIRVTSGGELMSSWTTMANRGFVGAVTALEAQPDGRVLVAGTFRQMSGQDANGFARLNVDGSLDGAFTANIGSGTAHYAAARDILVSADGKITVVGEFDRFSRRRVDGLIRLLPDGTADLEFLKNSRGGYFVGFDIKNNVAEEAETGAALFAATLQADGALLVAGEFVIYDETQKIAYGRVLRLSPNGQIDKEFSRAVAGLGFTSGIYSLVVDGEGRIMAGCDRPFARLMPNGALDADFARLAGYAVRGQVNALVLQPNGRILLGGRFNAYKGIRTGNIVRINTDGTLDERFLMAAPK